MSAKTRHGNREHDQQLANVIDLSGQAIQLTRDGKRTKGEVEVLRRALQLFKNRTLVGALERGGAQRDADLQALLSMDLASSGFSAESARYFRARGVRYLGETYRIYLTPTHETRVEAEQIRLKLGLPLQMDVTTCGWTPPYWADAKFRGRLDQSLLEKIKDPLDLFWYAERGWYYSGQFLWDGMKTPTDSRKCHAFLRTYGIHGAALLPPDWKMPTEDMPESWVRAFNQCYADPRNYRSWKFRGLDDERLKFSRLLFAGLTALGVSVEIVNRYSRYSILDFILSPYRMGTLRGDQWEKACGEVTYALRMHVSSKLRVGMTIEEFVAAFPHISHLIH